jgi:hypothetical protein
MEKAEAAGAMDISAERLHQALEETNKVFIESMARITKLQAGTMMVLMALDHFTSKLMNHDAEVTARVVDELSGMELKRSKNLALHIASEVYQMRAAMSDATDGAD